MKLNSVNPTLEIAILFGIERAREADAHLAKGSLHASVVLYLIFITIKDRDKGASVAFAHARA